MMALPSAQVIAVSHAADVAAARFAARQLAEAVGIDPQGCEEVALAAGELASNLVKHAGGGQIVIATLSTPERQGLQLESVDNGPGIINIHQALTDGYSTTGSLGIGLGAVNRLMDEFEIEPRSGPGMRIVSRKWARNLSPKLLPCPFEVGVATRPKPGYEQNGDDFVVKHSASTLLVGVIDGLGHGEPAHLAAVAARNFVEAHCEQSLDALFRGSGYACQGTRGCVMALARLDWERQTIAFGSVGNIEAKLIGSPAPVNLIVRRGIVGMNSPAARISEHPWGNESILLMYSDGIGTHWDWRDYAHLHGKPASHIAQALLRALAKPADDATLLIVKKSAR